MSYIPCRERTFTLSLANAFEDLYWSYLLWLRHLLQRLGGEHTLALWKDTFREYDDELLVRILSSGWEEVDGDGAGDLEQSLAESSAELLGSGVEGVSAARAREIVENTPPLQQIRRFLPSLHMQRQSTAYEALHLLRDALALLAEAMLDRYGKQGELIAYDAVLEEWPRGPEPKTSVEDFLSNRAARFRSPPEVADVFSAGLEVEFIRASETEVVTRVVECEWARYFQERHPRVGYLLACSADNAAYRSFNDRIRLQRTSTLMEGAGECDFRVYDLGEPIEPVQGPPD